jgi:SAM-dependent methyltransferase
MPERERWGSGEAYEPFIGRWSRRVAERFVEWLDPQPGARWLDVGCGTGALTEAILSAASPESVLGVDPSPDYLAFARSRLSDTRAGFKAGDAQDLPGGSGSFDYVVSGLVLNFVPNQPEAVAQMVGTANPSGTIAAYVWDYAEGMEVLRRFWDAVIELDPDAAALDEGARFPICRPEPLRSLWIDAGLREIDVAPIDIDAEFDGFEDYWSPFLGGQGPGPTYVASLDRGRREALAARISETLPRREDGSIGLRARAWSIRGLL